MSLRIALSSGRRKARRLPVAKWINAYEALPTDAEHILPPPVTLRRPPNYGPRKVDETAMQRQNLNVSMSIRSTRRAPTRTARLAPRASRSVAGVARQARDLRYRTPRPASCRKAWAARPATGW